MSTPKTYTEFQQTLSATKPSKEWPEALRAMWYDANGDWNNAHEIGQELHSSLGSWIHGYLHIKEGDEFNAKYWYNRAKRKYPLHSLEVEQRVIVDYILSEQGS